MMRWFWYSSCPTFRLKCPNFIYKSSEIHSDFSQKSYLGLVILPPVQPHRDTAVELAHHRQPHDLVKKRQFSVKSCLELARIRDNSAHFESIFHTCMIPGTCSAAISGICSSSGCTMACSGSRSRQSSWTARV